MYIKEISGVAVKSAQQVVFDYPLTGQKTI